ncbi:5-formyltetrahydrofolate cyclo-ligase [Halalkalibacillus halophilus]|uniref:5-formyltetrahydrofolate cyclo-ligase n=1 Tax=Halalkalibacillus halophilus TaxID=392827 RepID=UPI0004259DAC|nr:5-formyltetrahydrofolate cyclo-ligase [Halalkalibacillus halophilus]
MYKSSFRILGKRLLKNIPRNDKSHAVRSIEDSLFQSPSWKSAKTIAITIPREFEIPNETIIEQAWRESKRIVIPKCYPKDDHAMSFYTYSNKNELENVYLDLYEPKEIKSNFVEKEYIDLIIVPGLLYDSNGFRIGYGGGYYDRYLSGFNGSTISIAMEEQILPSIPHDHFDIPVHSIITNQRIIHTLSVE